MESGEGNFAAHRLGNLLHEYPQRLDVANAPARSDVAQQDLLIDALDVLSGRGISQGFWETAVAIETLEVPHNGPNLGCCVEGARIMGLADRIEILVEPVRTHMLDEIAAAQRRGNLMAQHGRVASRDKGTLARVRQATGELLPTIDILDFVKEEKSLVAGQLLLHEQDVVEILGAKLREPLVFEVDVDDALP